MNRTLDPEKGPPMGEPIFRLWCSTCQAVRGLLYHFGWRCSECWQPRKEDPMRRIGA